MLSSIAWREVRNMWQREMEERPKLGMLNEIAALEWVKLCSFGKEQRQVYDDEVKGRYSCIPNRGGRVGRWKGVVREERLCKKCNSGEVEVSTTGCCIAIHWISWDGPWRSKSASVMAPRTVSWEADCIRTIHGMHQLFHFKPYQWNVVYQIWPVMWRNYII